MLVVCGNSLINDNSFFFKLVDRPKSLILCSPTRFGKTVWARSLGKHMYFGGMFNLDDWDETAEYIVFDDFEWDYFKRWKKNFFGAQKCFVLTDKYRKKITVNWGKPCIYLCNEEQHPRLHCTGLEWNWIFGNVYDLTLQVPLY